MHMWFTVKVRAIEFATGKPVDASVEEVEFSEGADSLQNVDAVKFVPDVEWVNVRAVVLVDEHSGTEWEVPFESPLASVAEGSELRLTAGAIRLAPLEAAAHPVPQGVDWERWWA